MLGQVGLPALLITHDPADVEVFGDQLALYDGGSIRAVLPFRREFGGRAAAPVLEQLLAGGLTQRAKGLAASA